MNRTILIIIGIICALLIAAGIINPRPQTHSAPAKPYYETGCDGNCKSIELPPSDINFGKQSIPETVNLLNAPLHKKKDPEAENFKPIINFSRKSAPGNPVPFQTLQGLDTDDWAPDGVGRPFILKEDGIYKMWYTANNYHQVSSYWCNGASIAYAESADGVNWTNQQIVHSRDNASTEHLLACEPWIIKDDGIYRMWHTDYYKWVGGDWSTYISLLVSIDGINWAREKEVLIGSGNFSDYDDYATRQASVIMEPDGTYMMWYATDQRPKVGSLGDSNIARATSANGTAWTKKQLALARIPNSAQVSVAAPDVIRNNDGTYTMYYANGSGSIYRAFSPDGINWTDRKLLLMKNQLDSGILNLGSPYYFKDTDNTEYLYFIFTRPSTRKLGFKEYIGRARLKDIISCAPLPGADAPVEPQRNPATSGEEKIKLDDIDSITIVKNDGRNNKLLLEGNRRETFLAELTEILKRKPKYGAVPPPGFTMAPDFTITLAFKDKSHRELLGYGHGCVLLDTKSKASYQFYMGEMIYNSWLNDKPVK